jgi:uncharacterized protein with HEPN domain
VKDDSVYLRHILDAINKIESYISVGHDAFLLDSHWQDAVIRQLEIMGEATKRVSEGLRSRYPDIPWKRVAGLRDVLIHDYFGVDLEMVWEIAKTHLPQLKPEVEAILSAAENSR